MRILDRYVGWQLAFTTFVSVSVLSVVLVLGNAFKQLFELLVSKGASVEIVFIFLGYILPYSLVYTLPWGFLIAVLLVFGRMSAECELIALRSSGVSFLRITKMAAVIALVCAGICFWMVGDLAPRAQVRYKRALYDLAIQKPLSMFENDRVIDGFPGHKIYVERSEGQELFNLLVFELDAKNDPKKVIFAKRGNLQSDIQNHRLMLEIFDARYEERDHLNTQSLSRIRQGITVQRSVMPISLQDMFEKNMGRQSVRAYTVSELVTHINAGVQSNETADPLSARTPTDLFEMRTELSRRFSISLASIALGLIALPLAVTAQRKETSVGFLLSLIVAFSYFFLMLMVGWVKSKPDWHPEWLIWTPNVVFLAGGAALFHKLARR
jgi:lipopolysaccharide export system permease protein